MKRFFYLAFLLFFAQPVWAAGKVNSWSSGNSYMDILMIVIFLFALLVLGVALVLLRTVNILAKNILYPNAISAEIVVAEKSLEYEDWKALQKEKPGIISRLMGLRPLSEEKDMKLEHEFDGIAELNNPTPRWFMVLFYSTILIAVSYMLTYHVFGWGKLQTAEYVAEMKDAEIAKKLFLAKSANAVDENSVKLNTEGTTLTAGAAIFKLNCVACHGDHAQGIVGPNLTDEYWLHGHKINQLFKTIKYGVLDKGMPTWEKSLSPKQISDVANYVVSLKGSKPANPKTPQGQID